MIFKKTLKFALCGTALAAFAFVGYAAGEVTLKNNTSVSWADFVNAINNPTSVKGNIETDLAADNSFRVKLNNAKTAWDDKITAFIEAQETVTTDSTAWAVANATLKTNTENAEKATANLTTAQTNYTTANEEYQDALGDVSVMRDSISAREKQLTAATNNATAAKAAVDAKYGDVIKAKQDTINANKITISNAEVIRDDNLDLMNALRVTVPVYTKETAPWLKTSYDGADVLANSFKPNGTATDIQLYYKVAINEESEYDDNDKETIVKTITLMVSFVPQDGWSHNTVNAAYNDIRTAYPDDIKNSTVINNVEIHFGYTNGKPNYGGRSIIYLTPTAPNNIYSKIATSIASAIHGISDAAYQVEVQTGTEETIDNKALYEKYESLYNKNKDQVETLTSANEKLQTEIETLTNEEETSTEYANWQNLLKTVDAINDRIEELQKELDEDNAIVAKYRATKDAEGNEYKGANDATVTYINYLSYQQTVAQNAKTAADAAVTTAQSDVNSKSNALTESRSALRSAKAEQSTAKTAYDNAEIDAQDEANKVATAAAQENYNDITLTADITATEPITRAYSGTINANGAIINVNITSTDVNTQTTLFNAFSGHVDDAGINGSFARNLAGATFTDVARWDGTNGRIYNETGTPTEYNGNTLSDAFGAFGYALRDNRYFGVDITTGKVVANSEAPSKVFSLTAYDLPTGLNDTDPAETQVYVQLASKGSNDMVTRNGDSSTAYSVPENRFAQSATADVAGLGLANVYYGTNNTCDVAKIVDRNDFYCPVTVRANAIDYSRELKGGYNSVCLPFVLERDKLPASVLSICEYEKVDFDTKKFWFKENASTVAANTPVLLVLKNGASNVSLNGIGAVTIAATDRSQIVSSKAMNDDSQSYGTLKKSHVSEFAGMEFKDYIYGLNTSGEFIAAAANATFPAFRMVIGTNKAVNPKIAPKSASSNSNPFEVMGIGIHNEDGEDITGELAGETTAVEAIETAVESLNVIGAQGQIIIESDADYGRVGIYTIEGKLATIAEVAVGTTTVDVPKGVYIVKGKKVMVK